MADTQPTPAEIAGAVPTDPSVTQVEINPDLHAEEAASEAVRAAAAAEVADEAPAKKAKG